MKVTFLNTKYSEKDEVKALGARWDPTNRKWFVPQGQSLLPFSRWLMPVYKENIQIPKAKFSELISDFEIKETKYHDKNLGAWQVDAKKYVLPSFAIRNKDFVCLDCGQKVILKRGEIRAPHFAHYYNNSNTSNGCQYYDYPTESHFHKDAKHRLAYLLEQRKTIIIYGDCTNEECYYKCWQSSYQNDGKWYNGKKYGLVKYEDGDEVVIEYRDPEGKYIADVALLNGDTVKYIFEIKHTHTTTSLRPDPWFEIESKCFFKSDFFDQKYIQLKCVRQNLKRYCESCSYLYINPPKWLFNIPKLNRRFGDCTQDRPCLNCGRKLYSPLYFLKYKRQICKYCFEIDTDNVKHRFE